MGELEIRLPMGKAICVKLGNSTAPTEKKKQPVTKIGRWAPVGMQNVGIWAELFWDSVRYIRYALFSTTHSVRGTSVFCAGEVRYSVLFGTIQRTYERTTNISYVHTTYPRTRTG